MQEDSFLSQTEAFSHPAHSAVPVSFFLPAKPDFFVVQYPFHFHNFQWFLYFLSHCLVAPLQLSFSAYLEFCLKGALPHGFQEFLSCIGLPADKRLHLLNLSSEDNRKCHPAVLTISDYFASSQASYKIPDYHI